MEMKSLTIGGKTYDEFNPAAAEMDKKLDKTGGTVTGNINMPGKTLLTEQIELKTGDVDGVLMYSESRDETDGPNKPVLSLYGSNADQAVTIFNVETPTKPYEATNKKYVDSLYATPNNAPLTFTGAVEATYDGTEDVVVNIPSGCDVTGAIVGQTVKISAVDDNGVPTAWSAIDRAWKLHKTYAIKDMTFPAAISIPQNKDVFLVFKGTDITPDKNTNLNVSISTAQNETGYAQRYGITNKFYAHTWGCYIKMLLLWRENTQGYLPIVQTASAATSYPDVTKIGNPLGEDANRNYFYITVDNADNLNAETTGTVNIYTRDYI